MNKSSYALFLFSTFCWYNIFVSGQCGLPGGVCNQDPNSTEFQNVLKLALDEFNTKEQKNCDCLYETISVSNVSSQVVAGLLWRFEAVVAPNCDMGVQPQAYNFTVWIKVNGEAPEITWTPA
uniref:Cystatin domain-containing protein n=1 Tax=Acrobeloides nanus TaxID=290746 RepID=A0A914ECK4_9BILA